MYSLIKVHQKSKYISSHIPQYFSIHTAHLSRVFRYNCIHKTRVDQSASLDKFCAFWWLSMRNTRRSRRNNRPVVNI